MGQSPTINIEIKVDFNSALEIVEKIDKWIDHKLVKSDIDKNKNKIRYEYKWNSRIDTGSDAKVQPLLICWNSDSNKYLGTEDGRKLVIHYGSYYYEDSLERFADKAIEMKNILNWLKKNTDAKLNHYVSTSMR